MGWLKNLLLRNICLKRVTLLKALGFVLLLSVISSFLFSYHLMNFRPFRRISQPPQPRVTCRIDPLMPRNLSHQPHDHRSKERHRLGRRALIIVETQYSKPGTKIRNLLDAWRIDSKVEAVANSLPSLTHGEKGKFAVVFFENFSTYLNMDSWNRQLLDKYCQSFSVGIVGFVQAKDEESTLENIEGFPLTVEYNVQLVDYRLNIYSDVWRVTKPGEIFEGGLPGDTWSVFHFNDSNYEPLAYSLLLSTLENQPDYDSEEKYRVPVIHDRGQVDGIQRVLFGGSLDFWLHHVMLMDIISYLSHGKLSMTLDRYIQIDIDDIFVGKEGTRMKVEDVEALVASQKRLQAAVDGFHFNLGFSGRYYLHGTPEEDAGDKKLLEYRHQFWWFGHMYRHEQAHKLDLSSLESTMISNKQFAQDYDIPVTQHYAVAPHHSGVYPVHEELYQGWRSIWDIKVTSTEEYPSLYPFWRRRGFIHNGIMVLPRQTCGLYTHTVFVADFKSGLQDLEENFKGGELFLTILYTPNPCDYKRHIAIWSQNKSCNRLPRFLVVGPQKTGTTALYSFLSMHPGVTSNVNSPTTFEEVQFFSSNNYYKGLDWYMEFFPDPANTSATMLFEKSATYFDNENVPQRVFSLIPRAKIICILIDPAKRAYSWYQHMRSKADVTALNYTFYSIITADERMPRHVRELQSRCLVPGMYAQHLVRWLDYFPSRQVFIIDGEQLRNNPIHVMHKLQQFLHVQPYFDYSQHLRYDSQKGFFCQVLTDRRNKCLGRSKGRTYQPMDEVSAAHLRHFYRKYNINLSKLLNRLNTPVPDWLQEALSDED
ncbi:bifunctional heparan sulfate N-deacetylase/N-sulfotransferase-like isoform X2 [Pomacea canaliculata]|uniref:bifunctional heparan sulfate N-deacetylase/N-sulfotransferase-like isoform X2 n=1 Tax=Pomacea canaliculata TaxID=400727 RepID=UPI000D735717|nr:bifunctional heparan sulfate N-deacetylase/N-sulfotransferase-like isoform X2 [Pomacea canaliculata]